MKFKFGLALAASALMASAASAGVLIVTGDTTGQPTYNRTFAGNPPTQLSVVGDDVRYAVTAFTVSEGGEYTLLLESSFDNFLSLYQGSFDPANPLDSILQANDDAVFTNARIIRGLASATNYFAVASAFSNTGFGAYTLTIRGPGDISLGSITPGGIPEPATWGMMILGFGLVGATMRRRAGVAVSA